MSNPSTRDIRRYWEAHPLSSQDIPHEPGTAQFFEHHKRLRYAIEPPDFLREVYEPHLHAGKRALDVGCGTGFVVATYAAARARVVGIDLAERSLRLTRKRLALEGLDAELLNADAERLPFADRSFDLVTSFGVLHHSPSPEAAVAELHRVLRPGGKAIVMFYHRDSYAYRVRFPMRRALARMVGRPLSAQQQVNAVDGAENPLGRVYSREELAALFSRFENLEFRVGYLYSHWERVLPAAVVDALGQRWGFFLYLKAFRPRES